MQSIKSGELAGTGSFRCVACDYALTLEADEPLPRCPVCDGQEFERSMFAPPEATAQQGLSDEIDPEPEDWTSGLRDDLAPGEYLAYRDGDETVVVALAREWTRIGRSLAADVRFDDPTVSRRHALLVRQADGIRLLDDRSLNGVFVNGERVEWSTLADGDEVVVGRHRLCFVSVPHVSGVRDGDADGSGITAR